jgi:O-antigen/teichoic acid export membrane protein
MALIAAGAKTERVAGEFIASAVQLGVTWTLLPSIGVIATGIAINAVNVVQALLYYYWVRRSVQFRWSAEVYSALLLGAVTLGSALAIVYLLPQIPATLVGSVLLTCSAAYCLRRIAATAGVSRTGLVNRLLSLRESIVKKIRR